MNTVKALGCAVILLCATFGVSSAKAADLEDTAPSWTGPFIGVNVGYGWDTGDRVKLPNRSTDPQLDGFVEFANSVRLFPRSLPLNADGVLGGGQIGYNWQPSSDWVLGVEADFQGADIKDEASTRRAPGFDLTETGVGKKIDWFGTARLRAGYLVDPQWLVYATGGLAYGETRLSFNTTDMDFGCITGGTICTDKTSSGVKLGWTAGGGTEVLLSPSWSLKAEYLYLDLGRRSFDAETNSPIVFKPSTDYHEHILRVGLNYHFD